MKKEIKGVIFDMDGLMIDSESVTFINHKKIIADMGYDLTFDVFKKTIGCRSLETGEFYKSIYSQDLDCEKLRLESKKLYREYLEKNGVPVKKGLFELLEYLKSKKIKCAVATSTRTQSASYALEKAGITPYMDVFVFGDMVENGKPAPDIFLKACAMIGEKPEDCLGIEDSYNGVRAIYSAKMMAAMVPDILQPTDEMKEKTYVIVDSLDKLIEII